MNDIHRAEIAYLGRLLHVVVRGWVHFQEADRHRALMDAAYSIAMEPLDDLPEKHKHKLKRRVSRMDAITITPHTGDPHTGAGAISGEQSVLTVYAFIENLVQQEYINMPADSPLGTLMDNLLALIDTETDKFIRDYDIAGKLAAQWLRALQNEGYFSGAEVW